jgi:hypothetical protein
MPDLTLENRWICVGWLNYLVLPPFLKNRTDPPPCHWNQEVDGGEPIERDGGLYCPKCGMLAKPYTVGT